MGRRQHVTDEEIRLGELIRSAHEAAKDLRAAIREANQLAPDLMARFEEFHQGEIQQLSNYFTTEGNRQSARLNAEVEQARVLITKQIMSGKAVFDADTRTVTISFGAGRFDDQVPPPYPQVTSKEKPE